ncbi:MAG: LAGLIDADG family homing endonuclease [bacterium]
MKKKVKKLKPVDAAYIAALIDGEGSVTLCRKNRYEYRRVDISINNSDKKMLEWVLKAVGAGKILPKKIYNIKHTPTFTYRIVCREALPFLEQITNITISSYLQKRKNKINT